MLPKTSALRCLLTGVIIQSLHSQLRAKQYVFGMVTGLREGFVETKDFGGEIAAKVFSLSITLCYIIIIHTYVLNV